MKKTLLTLLVLVQLPVLMANDGGERTAAISRFSLTVLAGPRVFASGDVRRIYPGGQMAFALDLGCRLGRSIEAFFSRERLQADGQLTLTREPSALRLTAWEGGARFLLPLKRFVSFVGAGAGYYRVEEENVIAVLDEKKTGFFALAGLRLRASRPLFAALQVKYVFLRLKPFAKAVDLGGLFAGIGIGVTF
jgi:opacity protein-like surface antigen